MREELFLELCLYAELLVFLAGTFLYAFLLFELRRRRHVLAGNVPIRLTVGALLVWFSGTLLDHLWDLLLTAPVSSWWGTTLDLVRASGWLLTFPLLAHALGSLVMEDDPPGLRLFDRLLVVGAYGPLLAFVGPAFVFGRAAHTQLGLAAGELGTALALHGVVGLLIAMFFTLRLVPRAPGRRLPRFLRILVMLEVALVAIFLVTTRFTPWSADAVGFDRLARTVLLGCLLLPGALFAFYVHRFNLLRLSLSLGALRQFLTVLTLVAMVMLAGPTLAAESLPLFRRFVAWGLLLAVVIGALYRPLVDRAVARSARWRRLLGRNVAPQELDRLMARIERLGSNDQEAMVRTAEALSAWLGTPVTFLPPLSDAPDLAPVWQRLAAGSENVVHRLAPPSPEIDLVLAHRDLHAVFPLRVDDRVASLLGLPLVAIGGGYAEEELDAVQLVMRQLAGALAVRRLVDARVAEERRLGEQERLGLLGLVSASLAHEIKNPLSSMKALAQALRGELANEDPQSEGVADLDVIVEQIDRLSETAHEILAVARPRDGAATELASLIRSALYVLDAEARKQGVTLDGGGIAVVGVVSGSAASWQTIVFNLVLNALAHTRSGAQVLVTLERIGGEVRLAVANPGDPIPASMAARLFEPFVGDGRGTGLGLALVARRVGELGGQVTVEDDAGQVRFVVVVADCKTPKEMVHE